MADWIEINLPWYSYDIVAAKNVIDKIAIDNRGRQLFGKTYNESSDAIPKELWKEYHELEEELSDENQYSDEQLRAEIYKHERFAPIKQHREFAKQWEEWYDVQPEVVEQDRLDEIARNENKQKSFCGRGLNKAGTLIEYESYGKIQTALIGTINELGGVCDDCRDIESNDIVKRYKVVYEFGEQP